MDDDDDDDTGPSACPGCVAGAALALPAAASARSSRSAICGTDVDAELPVVAVPGRQPHDRLPGQGRRARAAS